MADTILDSALPFLQQLSMLSGMSGTQNPYQGLYSPAPMTGASMFSFAQMGSSLGESGLMVGGLMDIVRQTVPGLAPIMQSIQAHRRVDPMMLARERAQMSLMSSMTMGVTGANIATAFGQDPNSGTGKFLSAMGPMLATMIPEFRAALDFAAPGMMLSGGKDLADAVQMQDLMQNVNPQRATAMKDAFLAYTMSADGKYRRDDRTGGRNLDQFARVVRYAQDYGLQDRGFTPETAEYKSQFDDMMQRKVQGYIKELEKTLLESTKAELEKEGKPTDTASVQAANHDRAVKKAESAEVQAQFRGETTEAMRQMGIQRGASLQTPILDAIKRTFTVDDDQAMAIAQEAGVSAVDDKSSAAQTRVINELEALGRAAGLTSQELLNAGRAVQAQYGGSLLAAATSAAQAKAVGRMATQDVERAGGVVSRGSVAVADQRYLGSIEAFKTGASYAGTLAVAALADQDPEAAELLSRIKSDDPATREKAAQDVDNFTRTNAKARSMTSYLVRNADERAAEENRQAQTGVLTADQRNRFAGSQRTTVTRREIGGSEAGRGVLSAIDSFSAAELSKAGTSTLAMADVFSSHGVDILSYGDDMVSRAMAVIRDKLSSGKDSRLATSVKEEADRTGAVTKLQNTVRERSQGTLQHLIAGDFSMSGSGVRAFIESMGISANEVVDKAANEGKVDKDIWTLASTREAMRSSGSAFTTADVDEFDKFSQSYQDQRRRVRGLAGRDAGDPERVEAERTLNDLRAQFSKKYGGDLLGAEADILLPGGAAATRAKIQKENETKQTEQGKTDGSRAPVNNVAVNVAAPTVNVAVNIDGKNIPVTSKVTVVPGASPSAGESTANMAQRGVDYNAGSANHRPAVSVPSAGAHGVDLSGSAHADLNKALGPAVPRKTIG